MNVYTVAPHGWLSGGIRRLFGSRYSSASAISSMSSELSRREKNLESDGLGKSPYNTHRVTCQHTKHPPGMQIFGPTTHIRSHLNLCPSTSQVNILYHTPVHSITHTIILQNTQSHPTTHTTSPKEEMQMMTF